MAAGLLGVLREAPIVAAGVLLFAGFAATSSVFPTAANAENILRQAAPTLIRGIAMALVVLIGGIDLSVGSVVIASATTAGIALQARVPDALAMLAAISSKSVRPSTQALEPGEESHFVSSAPDPPFAASVFSVPPIPGSLARRLNALALARITGRSMRCCHGVGDHCRWRCAGPSTVGGSTPSTPGHSPALRPADRRRAAPLYRLWSARRRRRILAGARPEWSALDRHRPGIGDCRRGARRRHLPAGAWSARPWSARSS
jgi:hypothetical protein